MHHKKKWTPTYFFLKNTFVRFILNFSLLLAQGIQAKSFFYENTIARCILFFTTACTGYYFKQSDFFIKNTFARCTYFFTAACSYRVFQAERFVFIVISCTINILKKFGLDWSDVLVWSGTSKYFSSIAHIIRTYEVTAIIMTQNAGFWLKLTTIQRALCYPFVPPWMRFDTLLRLGTSLKQREKLSQKIISVCFRWLKYFLNFKSIF